MKHALTIDVEEFVHIHALSGVIQPKDWPAYPSSVSENTDIILDLLDQRQIHATFFCLGIVASQNRDLIKRIHAHGHEIACHGYSHQVIYSQESGQFMDDVVRAKSTLEDITGSMVIGYRAPTYSITKKTMWALDILQEAGFKYDSSIFPIMHDNYGIPDAPRFPYAVPGYRMVEFPISTVSIGSLNLPVSGGGYFRLLPYILTYHGLRRIEKENRPFIFYIHPWEFNPDIERIQGMSLLSRFRTYTGIKGTYDKFSRLIRDFSFSTVRDVLSETGLLTS